VTIFEAIYVISVALLAVYGYHALILAWYRIRRHKPLPRRAPETDYDWPAVTVQLPVYNERYVVERLIEVVCQLDYPRDRLQIQVLDDSTDSTQEIAARAVKRHREMGIDIEQVHRPDRHGYKGGALEHGLKTATGEHIAIFDADFTPPRDFLKRSLPYFDDDPTIGCVQTRWGHLNRESSWLTRAQASGIDGHFTIEQETRSEMPLFLNFNGTAGIWRRACIADAGGWHHDTLTEDLDLSYRAQLRGWRIRYLPHVVTHAELPAHISALKRQQFRWAKGSIQTARKLLGDLWRSPFTLREKIAGTIHLTNYAVHPLMLLNLILTLPIIHTRSPLMWAVPTFTFAALGPLLMYWLALREQGKVLRERFANLFMLVILGMGLSLNNTKAVLEGLLGVQSPFKRTPKFNLRGRKKTERGKDYLLPRDPIYWLEAALGIYAFTLLGYILTKGAWGLILWLLFYALGYGYVACLNFRQPARRKRKQHRPTGGHYGSPAFVPEFSQQLIHLEDTPSKGDADL